MLQNLRLKRVELSLTQQELGALSGLRQTYISELERGVRPRSAADISALARALGVTEAELIGLEKPLAAR